jgi:hypothetical protein
MCAACATMRPRASKSAADASRRSLIFGDSALRTSTAPISSAIIATLLARTESARASIVIGRRV